MLTVTGCYSYRAPEIIENDEYSENVDIFSIGVVLYECLTTIHPFMSKY